MSNIKIRCVNDLNVPLNEAFHEGRIVLVGKNLYFRSVSPSNIYNDLMGPKFKQAYTEDTHVANSYSEMLLGLLT